jgi:hypothetical protein
MSFCLHVSEWLLLDTFLWNLVFMTFMKICQENPNLVKVRQDIGHCEDPSVFHIVSSDMYNNNKYNALLCWQCFHHMFESNIFSNDGSTCASPCYMYTAYFVHTFRKPTVMDAIINYIIPKNIELIT